MLSFEGIGPGGGSGHSPRGRSDVITDWNSVQRYFADLAGDSKQGLLLNLKEMEFQEKYFGSLSTSKSVYKHETRNETEFIIDIKIHESKESNDWIIGTQIKVFFEGTRCRVKIGDLISYRFCGFECPLNSSMYFEAVTSEISDLKCIEQEGEKIPESCNTFIEFASLTAKKLAFAYVIYRMCKKMENYMPESEWDDYVTVVNKSQIC